MAASSATSNLQNVYNQVSQKFEITNSRILEAEQEVQAFYAICRKHSEICPKEDESCLENWNESTVAIQLHAEALDMYKNKITRSFEVFKNYINSATEKEISSALQIAEKTVQHLLTVQMKAEKRLKEIQEIIEEEIS